MPLEAKSGSSTVGVAEPKEDRVVNAARISLKYAIGRQNVMPKNMTATDRPENE